MAGPGQPGRPKKIIVPPEPENYDIFPPDGEDLAEVFDALPGEEKVISLYRIQPSGPPAFLISLSPDGLRNLSMIQEEFGGGKYKAVAKNFETGEKIERTFKIEGESKVKGSNLLTHDPKTGFFLPKSEWRKEAGSEERENGSSDNAMIRFLERQLDKMEVEIQGLKEQKSNGNSNFSEALALIIQAKDLIAPQVPVNQSTMDVNTLFSALTKGMDLVKDHDNDNGQPAWLSVIRELMPQVQQIISRVVTAPGPPKPGQPGQTSVKSEVIPPKDVTPPTGFQALIPMLEPYKQTFIDAAANDEDPNFFASMVVRRIPPDKKDEIIKWIVEGKWFPDLVSMDQGISLQRGWWSDFSRSLLAELTGQEPPTEESEEPEKKPPTG